MDLLSVPSLPFSYWATERSTSSHEHPVNEFSTSFLLQIINNKKIMFYLRIFKSLHVDKLTFFITTPVYLYSFILRETFWGNFKLLYLLWGNTAIKKKSPPCLWLRDGRVGHVPLTSEMMVTPLLDLPILLLDVWYLISNLICFC